MPENTNRSFDDQLVLALQETVRSAMSGLDVKSVLVSAGADHDGDPSLFIEVSYGLSRNPVDPKKLASLVFELRQKLSDAGENRFPIVRHHFAEKQKVAGFP